MSIPQPRRLFALALGAAFALASFHAHAAPTKLCFQTGNGKSSLALDPNTGYINAKAPRCTGPAVFGIDYFNMHPKIPARVGTPVVIKAANGRYVQFYGRVLRATAPKIAAGHQPFMFSLRPAQSGLKFGQPIAPKMKLALFPMQTRGQLMTVAVRGGGADVLNVRTAPPKTPDRFFVLAALQGPDPKLIAALKQKIVQLRADIQQRSTALQKMEAQLKQMMMATK